MLTSPGFRARTVRRLLLLIVVCGALGVGTALAATSIGRLLPVAVMGDY